MEEKPFTDLHHIFELTLADVAAQLENKTFCVRVKRKGKHDFSSIEAERYIGGGLNQHIEKRKSTLKNPDVTVRIDIEDDKNDAGESSSCWLRRLSNWDTRRRAIDFGWI